MCKRGEEGHSKSEKRENGGKSHSRRQERVNNAKNKGKEQGNRGEKRTKNKQRESRLMIRVLKRWNTKNFKFILGSLEFWGVYNLF